MVMCYGEARGNGRRALHMYQQQFQNRNHPHHTMFARLYQRLRDDGSLRPRRIGGRPRRHPFSIDDYTELKGKVFRLSCKKAKVELSNFDTKLLKCNELRIISLISHSVKILLRILNRRLYSKIEGQLEEELFGFRKGKEVINIEVQAFDEEGKLTGLLIILVYLNCDRTRALLIRSSNFNITSKQASLVYRSSTRVCVRNCISIRRPEFECSGPQLEGPEFECSGPQLEGPEFEYSELSLKCVTSRYHGNQVLYENESSNNFTFIVFDVLICSSCWKRQYFHRPAPLTRLRAYIHTAKQTATPPLLFVDGNSEGGSPLAFASRETDSESKAAYNIATSYFTGTCNTNSAGENLNYKKTITTLAVDYCSKAVKALRERFGRHRGSCPGIAQLERTLSTQS
ncbi:hypothetical protein ANN_14375 [Periplaneta americana]|uniref:DUF4817 domain-containing protein n=1 Tax=Periplaneta americana TaxID=6978 RepID=A0ABQ8SW52_PERAM|nr:hypothetical protein ANN_14375 [Periplaneta americana]